MLNPAGQKNAESWSKSQKISIEYMHVDRLTPNCVYQEQIWHQGNTPLYLNADKHSKGGPHFLQNRT